MGINKERLHIIVDETYDIWERLKSKDITSCAELQLVRMILDELRIAERESIGPKSDPEEEAKSESATTASETGNEPS